MRYLKVVSLLVLICVQGCRDEQAGVRNQHKRGTLRMNVLSRLPARVSHPARETFARGAVEYLGSHLEPEIPVPGKPLVITHFFRAVGKPPAGFGLFVHLVDSEGGLIQNLDHDVQGGAAPLDSWPQGAIIPDTHSIELPQDNVALRLKLGFWKDDSRLPVDTPSAHDGDNRLNGPRLLPTYSVRRATKSPKVDGVLDDDAWHVAESVTLSGSFDGRKASVSTQARLTYDDVNLYVAFECKDSDVWGTLKKQDDPIYNEEVVEIFLDADGDGNTYNELQVSPHNVRFDASFVSRRSDLNTAKEWVSGMTSAVRVLGTIDDSSDSDDRWFVEMAIPFKSLSHVPHVPPASGDVWRFNLYRLEHFQRTRVEGQAFSPLFMGDFHHLPRFGFLVFQ